MKKIDRLHGKLVPSRVALLLLLGLEVLFLQSINASRSSSAIGSVNSFNRRLHPHSSLSPSSSSASVLSPSLVELRLRYYYGQKIGNLRGGNIVNTNSSANSSANSSIEDNGKDDEESNVYHDVLHKTDEKALQHELSLHDESTLYVNTENKSKTISSSCSSINSSTSSTNNNNKNNNSSSKAQTNKMSKIQNAIERVIPAIIMLILFQQLITHTGETGLYILIPLMQFKMYKETTGIIEEYYKLKYQRKQIMVRRHGDNDPKEEVVVVVERGNNFDLKVNIEKWWWFMTIFVTTTGRFLRSEVICRLSPSMLKNKGETSILPLSSSVSSSSSPMIMILDQLYSIIENEHKFNLVVYGMVSIGLIMAVVGMASHVDASADKFRSYLGEVASFHFALIFLVGQSSFWICTIQSFGIAWILYPALLVIINDTMAYVFGVSLGRHKLLPKLSPNKTIEGFVGAALSTIGVSIPLLQMFVRFMENHTFGSSSSKGEKFWIVLGGQEKENRLMHTNSIRQHAIAMALYTSLVSPFGGFLASAVKRAHGAKDFGTLIPGHGGLVDRFDCQVVTAPFVFLYLQWYKSSL